MRTALAAALTAALCGAAAALPERADPGPASRTTFAVANNDGGRYELTLTVGGFDAVRTTARPGGRISVTSAPLTVAFRSRTPRRTIDVLWGSTSLNVYVLHRVPAALRRSRDAWIRRSLPPSCRDTRTGPYAGYATGVNRPASLAPGQRHTPRIRFFSVWDTRAGSSLDLLGAACPAARRRVPAADLDAWRRLLRGAPSLVVLAHVDPLAAGDDFAAPLARRAPIYPVDRCGGPKVADRLLTVVGVARRGSSAGERLAPGSAACRLVAELVPL